MQTKTENVRVLFGDLFLADKCLSLLETENTLPEYLPLSIDVLTLFFQEGFEIFYVPHIKDGVGVTSDMLMSLWKKRFPARKIVYDFDDEYKWYTKAKDSFWYKETLQEGWFLIKATPITGAEFSTYGAQRKKLASYLERFCIVSHEDIVQKIKKDIILTKDDETEIPKDFDIQYRSSFAEELLRMMCYLKDGRYPALSRYYVWTSSIFDDKEMVRIGFFDDEGADVTKRDGTDGNSQTSLTPVLHL